MLDLLLGTDHIEHDGFKMWLKSQGHTVEIEVGTDSFSGCDVDSHTLKHLWENYCNSDIEGE